MDVETRDNLSTCDHLYVLPFFYHNKLTIHSDHGNIIGRKKLVNPWSYHHFSDYTVYVQINNPKFKDYLLFEKHYYLWIIEVRYGGECGECMMGNRKEN
ncbi:MAG: hypothetical protein EHM85_07590 [Desulfobacteraceae bacterium]|nr:MAG: hypothetical protein EHM85_07590 [Desulfobacteraceae bacterium]